MPNISSKASVEVVAAPSGTAWAANAKARAGNSAMSVPTAMIPTPIQIQLTSGLTCTLIPADCPAAS
jgi:hypothetical protein